MFNEILPEELSTFLFSSCRSHIYFFYFTFSVLSILSSLFCLPLSYNITRSMLHPFIHSVAYSHFQFANVFVNDRSYSNSIVAQIAIAFIVQNLQSRFSCFFLLRFLMLPSHYSSLKAGEFITRYLDLFIECYCGCQPVLLWRWLCVSTIKGILHWCVVQPFSECCIIYFHRKTLCKIFNFLH